MGHDPEFDQAAMNALEARTQGTEITSARVRCPTCVEHKREAGVILRIYQGPDDVTGEERKWAYVPAFRRGKSVTPAKMTLIVERPGELAWRFPTQCGNCRDWWLLFPGGARVEELRALEGHTIVAGERADASAREQWRVGDEYVAATATGQVIEGAYGVLLLGLSTPTWGEVAE